jgi:hypothetical protein
MRAGWRRAAAALRGFLRGFLGLGAEAGAALPEIRSDARRAARAALERRVAARRSCC